MTSERARALVAAGIFCLTVGLGVAEAAEVYPGCAQPGPTKKTWWVDQISGKTPADGADGTQAHPWNSLNGIISGEWATAGYSVPGYTRPLLSNAVYYHIAKGQRVDVADQIGSPPVHPGDTIMLMNGNYGDIVIGAYNTQIENSDFISVKAAPGQTPMFSTLYIRSTNKWVFDGVKVQSLFGANDNKQALVTVTDQGDAHPTSDIILKNLQISTADNTEGWTQAQWAAQGRSGYREWGDAGDGTNGEPGTNCISVTGSHIRNVRWAVVLMGNTTTFSNNEIDHFGDDGIDYGANNLSIAHNYIHDNFDIGDGNHEDVAQGQNGPLRRDVPFNHFSNILIDSNLAIRQTDPKLAFPTYLQGIDAFDEEWTNVTVMNNVVVTSACWGIYFSSIHNGKIINNTVLADGMLPMPGNCKPLVAIGDKTHQGPSSSDNIIRNNIAYGFSIYDLDPNMTMDHNVCLGIDGKCQIVNFLNGKPNWDVYKPGMHGDHNLIDGRGAGGMFVSFEPAKFVHDVKLTPGAAAIGAGNSAEAPIVNFDPAKFHYDLRLRPEAPAIGAGASAEAPPVDITGAPRAGRIDAGAYQHAPLK